MSQMERIAFIDRRVRERGGVTVKEVAGRFEVSERQAKRDIEYMRDRLNAGIEYSTQKHAYYYESAPDLLDNFDEKTLLFYVFVKRIAENMNYLPVVSESLLGELSRHISRDYLPVSGRIEYDLTEFEQFSTEDVFVLLHALADRRQVDLVYRDSGGETSRRSIEPGKLINYTGKWYVAAFDHASGEFRTFLISRFISASLSKEPYRGEWDDARLEKFMNAGFGIFKRETVCETSIRFYDPVSIIVEKQTWHESQRTSRGTDEFGDYVEIALPVGSFDEILGKVLRYGSKARVVSPAGFAKRWKDEIRAMADKYLD